MSHAQHLHEERSSEQALSDRITSRIADLLEPSSTHETQWVRVHSGPCPTPSPRLEQISRWLADVGIRDPRYQWQVRCDTCDQVLHPGDGQKLVPRSHVVERPSLVDQLEDAIEGSTAGAESAGGFESRPAANLAALDTLGTIEREAAIWVRAILGAPAPTRLQSLLLTVAARSSVLTSQQLRDLDVDVLRWWAHARVTTTWDTAPLKPHVPCMNCDRRGGIQVRMAPLAAVCLHCGAAWDTATIGILGNHIQIAMSAPIDLEAETAAAAS